jgi:hypothetical protein
MANGSKRVVINPNADNTVTLKLKGQVFTSESREVAGSLNAAIAYWNTALGRNNPPVEERKLSATTSEIQADAIKAMKDLPKGRG